MNSKIFVSIALILSIVTCAILGTVNASAFEQQEINLSAANSTQNYVTPYDTRYIYYENETTSAKNDSISTANIYITEPSVVGSNKRYCERLLRGSISTTDTVDYYQIYVEQNKTYKIKLFGQLSTATVNLDLYLYDADGSQLRRSIISQANASEHILYTHRGTSGNVYIKVQYVSGWSGTNEYTYRLLVNEVVEESYLVQSFFPSQINADYFYNLGRNYPDKITGLIVLTVGYAAKDYTNNTYGVLDYTNRFVPLGELRTAIVRFAEGFTSNPSHTQFVQIAISIVNMPAVISDNSLERSPTIDSLSATQRLNLHGANYANMIKSANDDIVALSSSRVNAVYAAYDSEVDWNTYDNTYAWISGYGSVSGRRNIYVNADCPIAANGAETLTNKGWNYLRLRNVCCNPAFGAYPLPQVATRQAARNWLDFFNWLEKKQSESSGSSTLYTYNALVGLMNSNQYNTTGNFFCLNQIIDYIRNTAYTNQAYNYTNLRNKYGTSLPSSWFTKSTWCMSGTDYQLPAVFSSNTSG